LPGLTHSDLFAFSETFARSKSTETSCSSGSTRRGPQREEIAASHSHTDTLEQGRSRLSIYRCKPRSGRVLGLAATTARNQKKSFQGLVAW
jgi:hypothetical protein